MNNWHTIKVGDIGKIVTGKTPRTEESNNYGTDYMFIGPTDLHKHFIITQSEKMISSKGLLSIKGSVLDGLSILVGCIGWDMGNVALVNSKCATNQQINSITEIKESYNPLYIYYWLKNKKEYLFQIANVTRTPILNKSDFSKIELKLPNKKQQDEISNFLKTLDLKIELNNKINSELEAMSKMLYDYWFVQIDFPDANGKPYKSSGGKMVWNEELKREIPEGWEVKELKAIAKNLMGQSPKGESYNKEGIGMPLLNGPADYENGSLLGRTHTTAPTRICHKDDMVLCIRATIGKLTFAEKDFCLGRGVAAVRPNEKRYSEYIFYCLIQEIERFKMQATGSIIVGITKDDLTDSKCLIPSNIVLDRFHKISNPIFLNQRKRKLENIELASLRDWLLPMLMNGQITVSNVQKEIT